jgi:hypothetical protein
VAFALVALGSNPASAKSTINTTKKWDGNQAIVLFGCPDTTTYGQVITVPADLHSLNKFTFYWINLNVGKMVVRGEVYAWDGTKATGTALYESQPKRIAFADSAFHAVTFNRGVVPVTPSAQYVLFASIDKDYEQCRHDYQLGWGAVQDKVYSGGTFVYQNNGGDESQWTATPWNKSGNDLAFKATLSP